MSLLTDEKIPSQGVRLTYHKGLVLPLSMRMMIMNDDIRSRQDRQVDSLN